MRLRHVQKKARRGKIPLDNVDIRSLLEDLNIDYDERGNNVSGGWVGVQCPFCDDQSNHLGINIQAKTISCWKCPVSGNVIKYLAEVLGSFNKALDLLSEYIPRELLRFDETEQRSLVSKVHLPRNAVQGLLPHHRAYLKSRGFEPDTLEELYNLHSVGPVGEFKNRIIVPIMHKMRLVTYTSVDISDDSELRYLHCPDEKAIIPIKEYLCGLEQTNGHEVIVVEGLFDWWRFGPGAVPSWGVKLTKEQIYLLSKFSYIKAVGDGDNPGWEFNQHIANELSPFAKVKIFDLPEGIDPDDLTKKEIKYIRNR